MNETDVLVRVAVALIVGFGIGIERGYSQKSIADGRRAAGVRTFTLLALLGVAGGMSTNFAGPWLMAVLAIGVVAFLVAAYRAGISSSGDLGLTTEMAAVATFVAGVFSGAGFVLVTALMGAAAILVLHNKPALHRLTGGIERGEIDAAVKVLAIAALLIPLTPDRGFGPGGVLNPREMSLAVVVIASLGLVGYGAIRILGPNSGLAAFGLAGGLVSSTGVTLSAANMARTATGGSAPFAAAAALAQAVMFVRTGALAAALSPNLFQAMAWPLAAGAAVALAAGWLLQRSSTGKSSGLRLGSPDTLNAAARFVAIAALTMLVAALAQKSFGPWGLYASGFLAGLVDVDAATVTAARLPSAAETGAFAMLLALTANSVSKTFIAWRIGGRDMGVAAGSAFLGSGLALALVFVGTLLTA